MDSEDGTYTINEKYLGRVEEVVNYALNCGMYVIVNDHWDSQWWGQFGACKEDADGKKTADETKRDIGHRFVTDLRIIQIISFLKVQTRNLVTD